MNLEQFYQAFPGLGKAVLAIINYYDPLEVLHDHNPDEYLAYAIRFLTSAANSIEDRVHEAFRFHALLRRDLMVNDLVIACGSYLPKWGK